MKWAIFEPFEEKTYRKDMNRADMPSRLYVSSTNLKGSDRL